MKVVLKSTLPVTPGLCTIDLPPSAEILCIKKQDDTPVLYFKCDVDHMDEGECVIPWAGHQFFIAYTGKPLGKNRLSYIGTLMFDNDSYVLHFFKLLK